MYVCMHVCTSISLQGHEGKRSKLVSGAVAEQTGRATLARRACFTIWGFPDLETDAQELAFPIRKDSSSLYAVPSGGLKAMLCTNSNGRIGLTKRTSRLGPRAPAFCFYLFLSGFCFVSRKQFLGTTTAPPPIHSPTNLNNQGSSSSISRPKRVPACGGVASVPFRSKQRRLTPP